MLSLADVLAYNLTSRSVSIRVPDSRQSHVGCVLHIATFLLRPWSLEHIFAVFVLAVAFRTASNHLLTCDLSPMASLVVSGGPPEK